MKFSELKGRAVVDVESAQKIGEVENLLLDPDSRQVVSLKVRTGHFSSARIIPLSDIKNVGPDAVTVVADQMGTTQPTQPAKDAKDAKKMLELTNVMGNKVLTDAGTLVGEVQDVLIDTVSLAVTGYEISQGGLFSKSQEISATKDIRYGDKMITVPAELPT